ncbi:hypothetical protein N7466_004790 [Penicillium verhagenii]|uniref:uncharacterized protein n=1 Tax=Penicillium verhagenii TaxID=1562060 RepID=UPI0025455200|nr:uncharacterized protein N7466_004790 [Penicillium verhagenii]KAJ5935243.1 hypothetical protein N7466_004790 [Penicillium verhagenii]
MDYKTEFFNLTSTEVRLLLLSIVCPKRIEHFDFMMLGELVNTTSPIARANYFSARERLIEGVEKENDPNQSVLDEGIDGDVTPTKNTPSKGGKK